MIAWLALSVLVATEFVLGWEIVRLDRQGAQADAEREIANEQL